MKQCPNCNYPIMNTSEGCPKCKTKFFLGKMAYRSNKLDKKTKFMMTIFGLIPLAVGLNQLVEYIQFLISEFSNFNPESLIETLFIGVLMIIPIGLPLVFAYFIYFLVAASKDITEDIPDDITDDENELK